MLSAHTQWKLALLKQDQLLREAQEKQRLEQAQEGKIRSSLWQDLAQSLGDRMIVAGQWLKAAAKPAPSPAAPECGA